MPRYVCWEQNQGVICVNHSMLSALCIKCLSISARKIMSFKLLHPVVYPIATERNYPNKRLMSNFNSVPHINKRFCKINAIWHLVFPERQRIWLFHPLLAIAQYVLLLQLKTTTFSAFLIMGYIYIVVFGSQFEINIKKIEV